MIDKLIKTTSHTENDNPEKNSNHTFLDVLWVKPMILNVGHLKVTEKSLRFCYNACE